MRWRLPPSRCRFLVFLLLWCAGTRAGELDRLLADLERMRAEMDVPALALTLVDRDGTIWSGAMGVADRASGRRASETTTFRIGSITKLFTALALQLAEQDGALDLETPLRALVPDAPVENPWEATHPLRIAHLLEHTAGLPDMSREEFDSTEPLPLRTALAWRARDRRTLWPPGLHHSYTNVGAGLAAVALETATGQTYEDFVEKRIFEPLEMRSATYFPDPETLAALATGYDADGTTAIPYWHVLYRAFGGINVRPADMGAPIRMLLNRGNHRGRQLLPAAAIERMERPETTLGARAGLRFGYGLGNYTWLHRGVLFHGHGGDGDGYLARLGYSREAGLGYFLVINVFRNADLRRLQRRVEEYIVGDTIVPEPPAFALSAKMLAGFAGDYEAAVWRFARPEGTALRIEIDLGEVYVWRRGKRQRLIPVGEALFRYEGETLATCVIVPYGDRIYFQDEHGSYVRVRRAPASIE